MYELLPWLLNMSITAGLMILVVLAARLLLRRAPRAWSYALWAVVLFRLLCPVSFTSEVSLLGAVDAPAQFEPSGQISIISYVPENIVHDPEPSVQLPIPALNEAINPTLPQGAEQTVADPLEAPVSLLTILWALVAAGMLLRGLVLYLDLKMRLWRSPKLERGVCVSDRIKTAFVAGIILPRIYLPEGLTERERECVLAHERCHIRRGDFLIKPLAYIALCLHWFNPLVWLAWVVAMRDMEVSCDEAALRRLGSARRADYAQTLLNMATGRRTGFGAALAFGDDTKRRIKEVAKLKPAKKWISVLAAVLALAVIAGCASNPAGPGAEPDATPSQTTVKGKGMFASVEDMLQLGLERSLGSVTWTASSVYVFPATDGRIEGLQKVCEIEGLDPDAVIEGWTYDVWYKLDIDEEEIAMSSSMQRDGDWFNLNGTRLEIVKRYPDGSYDPFGWRTDLDEKMMYYDSYYEFVWDEYMHSIGGMPVYVLDWTGILAPGDTTPGRFPAERYDGDGWYLYLPMNLWQFEGSPMSSHANWVFTSAYGTGSTVVVERLDGASEYDSKIVSQSDNGAEHEYKVVVPDGEDSHYVITASWNDDDIVLNEYTATEPTAAKTIAGSFCVGSAKPDNASGGEYGSLDDYFNAKGTDVDTLTFENTSGGVSTAGVLAKDVWREKRGEISGIDPDGTLEAWVYVCYYNLDAEASNVSLRSGSMAHEGWYNFDGGNLVFARRYTDGSYSILREEPLNESIIKYPLAVDALWDWYVTENDIDLPLTTLDWGEELGIGSCTASLIVGDGWYAYCPSSGWSYTKRNGGVVFKPNFNTGASFSVKIEDSAQSEISYTTSSESSTTSRTRRVPDGDVTYVVTGTWNADNAQEEALVNRMIDTFGVGRAYGSSTASVGLSAFGGVSAMTESSQLEGNGWRIIAYDHEIWNKTEREGFLRLDAKSGSGTYLELRESSGSPEFTGVVFNDGEYVVSRTVDIGGQSFTLTAAWPEDVSSTEGIAILESFNTYAAA